MTMKGKPTPRATKMGGGRSTPSLPQKSSMGGGSQRNPPGPEKMSRAGSKAGGKPPGGAHMGGRSAPPKAG